MMKGMLDFLLSNLPDAQVTYIHVLYSIIIVLLLLLLL